MDDLNFAYLLRSGTDPKAASHMFLTIIKKIAERTHLNWHKEISHIFIRELFRSVGIIYRTRPQDLDTPNQDDWRNDNVGYVFFYDSCRYKPVEIFIEHLANHVDTFDVEFMRQFGHLEPSKRPMRPLFWYSVMLCSWVKLAYRICSTAHNTIGLFHKFFREPIIRISYFILSGTIHLYNKYHQEYPCYGNVCTIILMPLREGLLFESTHDLILFGVLKMFKEYYQLFFRSYSCIWEFVYFGLCSDIYTLYQIDIIETFVYFLTKFLNEELISEEGVPYMRILTNILIKEKMIRAYHNSIKGNKVQLTTLRILSFLEMLQSCLPSTECFKKDFLTGILQLILNETDAEVRKSAANLYFNISRRQQTDKIILLHILEVFLKMGSIYKRRIDLNEKLVYYFQVFMEQDFPFMKKYSTYLTLINDPNSNSDVRFMAAQGIVAIFKINSAKIGVLNQWEKNQMYAFLRDLPSVLEETNQKDAAKILMTVLNVINYNNIYNEVQNGPHLLDKMEDFSVKLFLMGMKLMNREVFSIFSSFWRAIHVSGNKYKLRMIIYELYEGFVAFEREMDKYAIAKKVPNRSLLLEYRHILRRLNCVLQTRAVQNTWTWFILDKLIERFIKTTFWIEVALESDIRYDLEAYECIVCAITAIRNQSKESNPLLFEQVKRILKVYHELFQRITSKDYAAWKTLFICISLLYTAFAPPSVLGQLHLQNKTYSILVGALNKMLFHSTVKRNLNVRENVALMFHMFTCLHQVIPAVPSYSIWKLLSYYDTITPGGAKSNYSKFLHEKLTTLYVTYITRFPQSYVHVLPIMIYDLNVRKPVLSCRKLTEVLKAHKGFIDQYLNPELAWATKLHGFFVTLEIVVTAVRLSQCNPNKNRLIPLKLLLIFIIDMRISFSDFQKIYKYIAILGVSALSGLETKELEAFQTAVNSYKSLCQQDDALGEGNETEPTTNLPPAGDIPSFEPYIPQMVVSKSKDSVAIKMGMDNNNVVEHPMEISDPDPHSSHSNEALSAAELSRIEELKTLDERMANLFEGDFNLSSTSEVSDNDSMQEAPHNAEEEPQIPDFSSPNERLKELAIIEARLQKLFTENCDADEARTAAGIPHSQKSTADKKREAAELSKRLDDLSAEDIHHTAMAANRTGKSSAHSNYSTSMKPTNEDYSDSDSDEAYTEQSVSHSSAESSASTLPKNSRVFYTNRH